MKQAYLTDLSEHRIFDVKLVRTEPGENGEEPLIIFQTDQGEYRLTAPPDLRYGMYIDSMRLNPGITLEPLTRVQIKTLKGVPGYEGDEVYRWTEYLMTNRYGTSVITCYVWDDHAKAPLKELKPVLYKVS